MRSLQSRPVRFGLPAASVVCLPLVFALLPAGLAAQGAPGSTGEAWQIITPAQASLVLGRDGALIGELGRERRINVALRTLPKYVGHVFVSVEDKRFYQHDGVDLVGVAGAIKDAVTKGNLRGASTITQLLVGNMHPDLIDRRDVSAGRKLREQQAAREMERHYTKEQILEAFLNQISFGRGAYGIEMAARQFFGKGAADLTLAEAASLASMPKSPVQYDPARSPDRNRTRRNTVLALMAEQKYITAAQSVAAQREPVRTVAATRGTAPWVVDVVRVQAERAGIAVMQGGYRIHTTIDDKVISSDEVRELLGRPKVHPERLAEHDEVGISTGMYYTPMGGDIMFVEASIRRGSSAPLKHDDGADVVRVGPISLILTGQLGDVMKESARAALTYATNNAALLGIPADRVASASEAHIHVPAGAIPKDGPSAGIAIALALVSEMSNRKVRRDVSMTGEITLRGRVLPIGGVKEKVLGAHRAGIKEVIIPKANEADLEDVPDEVREQLIFHPVETMREVLAIALVDQGRAAPIEVDELIGV